MIHFVIPAHDEAANVPRLMRELVPRARDLGGRILVVDDGSTDGTAAAVAAHADSVAVEVLAHPRNLGVGAALATGLRAALAEASPDDAIVTLEADATSDLDDLPAMLARLEEGWDVVLASAHAPGGGMVGVARWRRLASKAVSRSFAAAGGPRGVRTFSSLYRAYRAGALARLPSQDGRPLLGEPGFAASVELLLRLHAAGATMTEVPTVNDWRRRAGTSQLSLRATLPAYGRLMYRQLARRPGRFMVNGQK